MFDHAISCIIDSLGQSASYFRKDTSETFEIRTVYERKHLAVQTGIGVEASMNVPTAFIRLSDLPFKPKAHDKLTIDGTTYVLTDVQLDGQGGADLILKVRNE